MVVCYCIKCCWIIPIDGDLCRDEMSKLGICLGGVENGKMIYCDDKFYYASVVGGIVNYCRVDLKFRKGNTTIAFPK